MSRQTEPNLNNALGSLLQNMLPQSQVRSENTNVIYGNPGLRPDILIYSSGGSPVVIEGEYAPARNVENEAKHRLGLETTDGARVIESSVAIQYPEEIKEAHNLFEALSEARLLYCIFTENKGTSRFPKSGWLRGNIGDLADILRIMSVPQRAVDQAFSLLQTGIDRAARLLDEMSKIRPSIIVEIAQQMGMANVPQTRRMACAILASALVYHDRISGLHEGIKPLAQVCSDNVNNPQSEMLSAWDEILGINYWPIFAIAKSILGQLDSENAATILKRLSDTAQSVRSTGVENAHDLTGRIFQRLIADRKNLATYYTLPASASLLARLAVAKLETVNWASVNSISNLRIGDFACGTGALLSAVYGQIGSRHEQAGGIARDLHRVMMEEVLYGCDVMPSATHMTCSTLSGVEPSVGFGQPHLYTMAYGRQKDKSVALGSLELLQSSYGLTLLNTSDPATRTGSTGEEAAKQVLAEIPDNDYDLVIMNPPFTRNVTREGEYAGTTAAAFAAFGASKEDQDLMSERMKRLKRGTCYHGNAGLGSAFGALAHKKLKPGGVLALVLPLSVSAGSSWQSFRDLLADNYAEIAVYTIAAADNDHISFSADTDMAECLIVARKSVEGNGYKDRTQFTSFNRRPQSLVDAISLAGVSLDGRTVRGVEDGPVGATPLMIGDEIAGRTITTPRLRGGEQWGAVRMSDHSLAQSAFALSRSQLWLPGNAHSTELKMALLKNVGRLGIYHLDISGKQHQRSPFDKLPYSPTATFPSLWNHKAENETRMICTPDSQLQIRQGMEQKAARVWATASRAHLNLDFRFTSQPLQVAFTEQASIGGTAWPNVIFDDKRFDYALAVWANSTLGLLCFWWHSNRQTAGRGRTTIRAAEFLPVLDFRSLSDEQLLMAELIFEEFRDREFEATFLADADPNRALLDRRVICDLLGFSEGIYMAVRYLSAKLCAEPSVHGGKPRSKNAKPLI